LDQRQPLSDPDFRQFPAECPEISLKENRAASECHPAKLDIIRLRTNGVFENTTDFHETIFLRCHLRGDFDRNSEWNPLAPIPTTPPPEPTRHKSYRSKNSNALLQNVSISISDDSGMPLEERIVRRSLGQISPQFFTVESLGAARNTRPTLAVTILDFSASTMWPSDGGALNPKLMTRSARATCSRRSSIARDKYFPRK